MGRLRLFAVRKRVDLHFGKLRRDLSKIARLIRGPGAHHPERHTRVGAEILKANLSA
jgi:hypothetical protein